MVHSGPWPAARSLSQKLQEILQRATSNKRQAASNKQQATSNKQQATSLTRLNYNVIVSYKLKEKS